MKINFIYKLKAMVTLLSFTLSLPVLAESRLGFFDYERNDEQALLSFSSQWNEINNFSTNTANNNLVYRQSSEEQSFHAFTYSSARNNGLQFNLNTARLLGATAKTDTSGISITHETADERWLSGITLSSTNPSNSQSTTASTVLLSRFFDWSQHELRVSAEANYLHDHSHLNGEVSGSVARVSYKYEDTQNYFRFNAARFDYQQVSNASTGVTDWNHNYVISTQYLHRLNQWRVGFTRTDTHRTDPRSGDTSGTYLNAIYETENWQLIGTIGRDKTSGQKMTNVSSGDWIQDSYTLSYVYTLNDNTSLVANATHLAANQSTYIESLSLPNHSSVERTAISLQLLHTF